MEKMMIHLLLFLTIAEKSSVFPMEFTMFQEIKIFTILSKKISQLAIHQMSQICSGEELEFSSITDKTISLSIQQES